MTVVVSGGYVTSDALGETSGETVMVSTSVRIAAPGWVLAERFGDPQGIRLTSGSTSLDVATIPFTGTDVDLLASYVGEVLEPDAEQFQVSEVEPIRLDSGLTGPGSPTSGCSATCRRRSRAK